MLGFSLIGKIHPSFYMIKHEYVTCPYTWKLTSHKFKISVVPLLQKCTRTSKALLIIVVDFITYNKHITEALTAAYLLYVIPLVLLCNKHTTRITE